VLETILALPIFVIMLMGLVEFGVLVENLQHVEAASRAGVVVASRTADATLNLAALPADVLAAVNNELDQMHSGAVARQVRLETNVTAVGGVGATFSRTGGKDNAPDPYIAVTAPAAPATAYVRVTVFVDVPDVTPNVLAAFGIDFSSEVVQQTTTFPWTGP
jgi:Flp pilus assembly protein TadG